MIRFHKEGNLWLLVNTFIFAVGTALVWAILGNYLVVQILLSALLFAWWVLILQFFRNPDRSLAQSDASIIYAPADGKIVVIEEVEEPEFFKDKRIQVSIFMSPLNVHVNRNPIDGVVEYVRYHKGKYLAAWHPKASTENERSTVVYTQSPEKQILMRQVAGALAKRIVYYVSEKQTVQQGEDMGFIKLGSRVDLYLPLGTKIEVKVGDISVGNRTVIAKW
jgi:phosphatidylserine decarboxylase